MSQDNHIRTALRVPPELHAALHKAADESERSFNAEIIERLKGSFDPAPSADGAATQELADSRGQTIRVMQFIQQSLCESVVLLFGALSMKDRRDRHFIDANRVASSLLVGTKPEDYLLGKVERQQTRPAFARFVEETEADMDAYAKKEARTRAPSRRT